MFHTGRISGVLLPIFSLRSRTDFGVGDFGAMPAFMNWLKASRQKMWMLLPLLPTAPGDSSPYATRSAFGLDPLFIHLHDVPEFVDAGGEASLTQEEKATLESVRANSRVQYAQVFPLKWGILQRAFQCFEAKESAPRTARAQAFETYLDSQSRWLADFSLYAAVSQEEQQRPWWEWPEGLKNRNADALAKARTRLAADVRFQGWLQWIADSQWRRIRQEAKTAGILLCGDEPFIIGQDSSDAWAHPHLLRRDARLGVPPDDFSVTGQDWGLPYFDFAAMERDDYAWLKYRARQAATYFDLRRVDHAIGYFRQYIRDAKTPLGRFLPADEPSQRALGERNFRVISEGAGIVAEDLGVIPSFARETLARLELPGYRVMRWERDLRTSRHPSQYPPSSLATTGTHDTETLRQWWENGAEWEHESVAAVYPEFQKLKPPPRAFTREVHHALLSAAENSQSNLCVLPWQDVSGSTDRINLPGSMTDANWTYRIEHRVEDLLQQGDTRGAAEHLAHLTEAGRR